MDFAAGAILPPQDNNRVSTPGAGFQMPAPAKDAYTKNLTLRQFSDLNAPQQEGVFNAMKGTKPVDDPMAAIRALTQSMAPESPYVVGPILETSPGSYSNVVSEGAYVNNPYLATAKQIQEKNNPPAKPQAAKPKEDAVVQMMVPTPFGIFPVNVNMTTLGNFLGNVPKTPAKKATKPSVAAKAKGAKAGTKEDKGSARATINAKQRNALPTAVPNGGFFLNPMTGQPMPPAPPMLNNPFTGELIR